MPFADRNGSQLQFPCGKIATTGHRGTKSDRAARTRGSSLKCARRSCYRTGIGRKDLLVQPPLFARDLLSTNGKIDHAGRSRKSLTRSAPTPEDGVSEFQ